MPGRPTTGRGSTPTDAPQLVPDPDGHADANDEYDDAGTEDEARHRRRIHDARRAAAGAGDDVMM